VTAIAPNPLLPTTNSGDKVDKRQGGRRRRRGLDLGASCVDKGGEVEECSAASLCQNRGRNGGSGPRRQGEEGERGEPDGVGATRGRGGSEWLVEARGRWRRAVSGGQ
jgi:hypothetical protein